MKIENRKHLDTLYDIVKDSWELFQEDFDGDPGLEFGSHYKNLTLLHDHLQSSIGLNPTIVYSYEINFHTTAMNIFKNENECALDRLGKTNSHKMRYE